jgi:hypothetical protein
MVKPHEKQFLAKNAQIYIAYVTGLFRALS